ncbi:MAG: RNA polymerase sigma factor [Acidimicrobiales bacterium]
MPLSPDDERLLAGLHRRDEDAFRELLDRYDPLLRRVARRFVSSDTAAAEAVADTWVAVVRGIDRFEGRSSLRTWLVRVLTNQAIDRGVRESRQVPTAGLAEPGTYEEDHGGFAAAAFRPADAPAWPGHWASAPIDWATLPAERLEGAELLDQVRAAAAALPERQRLVFVLRDVEGWSSAEVAEALELTEGNQRLLLHRARGKVRAALDAYLASAEVAR